MKFHSNDEGAPCTRLENLLQEVADGSAKGIRKWYALFHASQCKHCGNFLDRLRVTLNAARTSKQPEMPEEARARLREQIQNLASGKDVSL